jgi:hypothetical protein
MTELRFSVAQGRAGGVFLNIFIGITLILVTTDK